MFQVNDTVICPGLGIGKIERTETRELSGVSKNFFIIKLLHNKMKVMIEESQKNLRTLCTQEEIVAVFNKLKNHEVNIRLDTWLSRHRTYSQLISTGEILNIAEVYHQLMLARKFKTLSFGERKMMDHSQELLSLEISHVEEKSQAEVIEELQKCY